MAVGIVLLAITRPYEGLLLCLPVAVVLGHWVLRGKNRPRPRCLLDARAFLLAHGRRRRRVAGVLRLPRLRKPPHACPTPSIAPPTPWRPITSGSSQRPAPAYRHEDTAPLLLRSMSWTTTKKSTRSAASSPQTLFKVDPVFRFFAGIVLLPPLIMLRRVFLDRRIRFLVLCSLVLVAGMVIEIYPDPSLPGALHRGLLCHWLAGHAPPARLEPGGQASRHSDGPAYRGHLCLLWRGCGCLPGPSHLASPEWPASNGSDNGTARSTLARSARRLKPLSNSSPVSSW